MVPLQEFIDLSECIEIVSDKSVPMLGYEFGSFFDSDEENKSLKERFSFGGDCLNYGNFSPGKK